MSLSIVEPVDFKCSIIQEARDTVTRPISFRDALAGIKTGRWAKQVEVVREAYGTGGKDAAAAPKKLLPGILFSGTFSRRAADAIETHSGLICADLDHLGDRIGSLKEHLIADDHVLAVFVSPTGSGLKVIFRCDPTKHHKLETFPALEKYVADNFGELIDEKCDDVSRICFVSHDPDLWANDDAKVIPYPPPEPRQPPKEFVLPPQLSGDDLKPGHDFNARCGSTVPDILTAHGWTHLRGIYWCRPGKRGGVSATWGFYDNTLIVHSSASETGFPSDQKGFDPFSIYTHLEHHGDWKAAARELGKRGYGASPKSRQQQNLERMAGPDEPPPPITITHPAEGRPLFDFNLVMDHDQSILLGERYLNRGDGAVIVSSSGMGKSAIAIQAATELALQRGPFGIQGNGPLKSLIIQSEDSDGDVAEVAYSVRHVLKLTPEQVATVNSRVIVVTDRVNRGLRFIANLKRLIAAHKPDLVWINPLQAFIDGDVTDSKDLGQFLREGLNSLNQPATFGYVIIHHTTKPATGKERAERLWHEVMYDMAGGAEIINWARAIISLRATPTEGEFNLVLAKRGRRAGVTKKVPNGVGFILEPVTTIPLRHAKGRIEVPGMPRGLPTIYWEAREADATPTPRETPKNGGRSEKYLFEDFVTVFPKKSSQGIPFNQMVQLMASNGGPGKTSVLNTMKRWAEQGHVEIIRDSGSPMRFRASV